MESVISIETWATILSYLKDINNKPVNPDQLVAIMKMSFVNKNFRNLIMSNNFWILYNSIEYESVKYNIYNWNENFCRMIYKIKTLKGLHDTSFLVKSHYQQNLYDAIFNIKYFDHNRNVYTFDIFNKEDIKSDLYCYVHLFGHRYYTLMKNDYCILFQVIFSNAKGATYCMKNKQTEKTPNYMIKEFANFCNIYDENELFNNINQFKYFQNNDELSGIIHYDDPSTTLYNNYIWSVIQSNTCNNENKVINFYAQNVITNAKYIVHQIEEINCFNMCNYHFDRSDI